MPECINMKTETRKKSFSICVCMRHVERGHRNTKKFFFVHGGDHSFEPVVMFPLPLSRYVEDIGSRVDQKQIISVLPSYLAFLCLFLQSDARVLEAQLMPGFI